jgi:hypothetical protein
MVNDTLRRGTYSGMSIHTVGQLSVGAEHDVVGYVQGCPTVLMWKCLLWKKFVETVGTREGQNVDVLHICINM